MLSYKLTPQALALNALCLLTLSSCSTLDANIIEVESNHLPNLPHAISNNAVAQVSSKPGTVLISFNGLTRDKTWDSTIAQTYVLAPGDAQWQTAPDVPGKHGRLASVAVGVGPYAYVFGGYTVAQDHAEKSLPVVHRFDPNSHQFTKLSDMPVPVDDAVALSYQDNYIYLISGWHDTGNVNLVQRYNIQQDTWDQATPFPGVPVFGHAAGIVKNQLLVCDGVKIQTHKNERRQFVMQEQCYTGIIDLQDSRTIEWRVTDKHPGAARYRMAAVGSAPLNSIVFIGGSDNPYNYNGVGYNGTPSHPDKSVFSYSFETNEWRTHGSLDLGSMDHRGLLMFDNHFVTVGGMLANQRVTSDVRIIALPD